MSLESVAEPNSVLQSVFCSISLNLWMFSSEFRVVSKVVVGRILVPSC